MRLKLLPWLIVFLFIILSFSAFVLYFYFEKSVTDELELRLVSRADDLVIDIARKTGLFIKKPEEIIFASHANEFAASGLLVQIMDIRGKVLAASPELKRSVLPFAAGEDDILRDVEFSNGAKLKIYQRLIDLEGQKIGYVIVGLPTSQLYSNLRTLGFIIVAVMLGNFLILVAGVNALASLNLIREQKKFLSFASHELRTPLAVISGHAEVALRRGSSPAEYREALATVKEESDWLSRLVANLLLIFRSESGMEKIKKTRFNFNELLVEESSLIKKRYPEKNLVLDLSPEGEINADSDQIRKLVRNLLDNAAKNTPPDGRINVKLVSQAGRLVLRVEDNGAGISRRLKDRIFDAYYRVERGNGGGMGLGLAIARWVVDAHRGKIRVESEEGKGAAFIVDLPRG